MIILDRQKSTETMKLCLSSSRKYLFVVVNQPFYQVVYRPNIFNPSSWLKTGLKALILQLINTELFQKRQGPKTIAS
jgi:hypothetical protein